MGIRAGLLTEIIVIEQECITKDDFGAEKSTWTPIRCARASVEDKSFQSNSITQDHYEMINDYKKVVILRANYKWIDDQKNRIRYRDKLYRIASIDWDRLKQTVTIIMDYWNE